MVRRISVMLAGAMVAALISAAPVQAQNRPDGAIRVAEVPFMFGGHRHCWADDGWHGPGFYWCGFEHRKGRGWGGPDGYHGWHH